MGLRTLLRNGSPLSPLFSMAYALFLSPRVLDPPPPSLWPLVLRSQCPLCCAVSRICSSPPSYAPYASRMDLRDAPRGASIPCAFSLLRILPVATGVYPSSEVLLLTNRLIFSPSSGNLTGASPCPVRKCCCA